MRWGDAAPPDPPALSTSAVPREPPKQVLRKIQGDFPLKTEKMPNWNFFKGKGVTFKGISRLITYRLITYRLLTYRKLAN